MILRDLALALCYLNMYVMKLSQLHYPQFQRTSVWNSGSTSQSCLCNMLMDLPVKSEELEQIIPIKSDFKPTARSFVDIFAVPTSLFISSLYDFFIAFYTLADHHCCWVYTLPGNKLRIPVCCYPEGHNIHNI